MNILGNFDLLSVGIAVAAMGILGFVIFFNNRQGATNRSFLLLTFAAICWSIFNYASYRVTSPTLILWVLRLVIFSAVWFAFSIFQMLYIFPQEKIIFPKWYRFLLLPVVILTSILTLSPWVFSSLATLSPYGTLDTANSGWGIYVFGALVIFLNVGGIANLFRKTMGAQSKDKQQNRLVLIGILTTVILLVIFNFILPAFFDNPRFLSFGAVFIFPFVAFTAYAIMKYHLFNVRVIAAETLMFLVVVVSFSEIIFATGPLQIAFRVGSFVILLFFGILLIRSVRKEVQQRERLEQLTREMERVNAELTHANVKLKEFDAQKSEFVSLVGHQLRAPMTVIKGYVSLIMDGTVKAGTEKEKEVLDKVMFSTEQLVKLVSGLLDLSRIESGKIKYEFAPGDFIKMVHEVIDKFRKGAEKKKITIRFQDGDDAPAHIGAPKMLTYDADKMREVVVNLIDNAIKYSSDGSEVRVRCERVAGDNGEERVRLSVTDTGIGIKPEDIEKLFVKFSRTDEAKTHDPNGVGIGLYFLKRVVEDHGGTVGVSSEGIGKGSTFWIELPVRRA